MPRSLFTKQHYKFFEEILCRKFSKEDRKNIALSFMEDFKKDNEKFSIQYFLNNILREKKVR